MVGQLLTPSQIADRLQVTEKTVYRWIDAGDLKAIKLGRLWRIKEETFTEFLQEKENRGD